MLFFHFNSALLDKTPVVVLILLCIWMLLCLVYMQFGEDMFIYNLDIDI